MTVSMLDHKVDNLGRARFIAHLENNSPEWHQLRMTGIGGSDIAAICRTSPWTSPMALWAKKTGRLPDDFTPSEAAEWGTRLESAIVQKFADSHPELEVLTDAGTWCHEDREWQLANPDALLYDGDKHYILEIKTAQFEDDWNDGVPAWYRTQIQWYMQTFGFCKAFVAVLFHGNKYREFEIEADEFEQSVNLQEVIKFRELIATDTKPSFDGALSTYETIRALHPDIESDTEVELGDLGMHLCLEIDKLAEQEKIVNRLKAEALDAMGKAKRGLVHDLWVFTRQARNGGKPYLIQKRG